MGDALFDALDGSFDSIGKNDNVSRLCRVRRVSGNFGTYEHAADELDMVS